MRICVCGLGYVGAVTAACLARLGHTVRGVDVIPSKVQAVNEGRAPFVEAGLSELVAAMAATGRLAATTETAVAVRESEMTLVCVGTPRERTAPLIRVSSCRFVPRLRRCCGKSTDITSWSFAARFSRA